VTRPPYHRNERIHAFAKEAWLDGRKSLSLLHQIRTTQKPIHIVETKCWQTLDGIQLILKATENIWPSQELRMAGIRGCEEKDKICAGIGHEEDHALLKKAEVACITATSTASSTLRSTFLVAFT
jgi:hypothetical protein